MITYSSQVKLPWDTNEKLTVCSKWQSPCSQENWDTVLLKIDRLRPVNLDSSSHSCVERLKVILIFHDVMLSLWCPMIWKCWVTFLEVHIYIMNSGFFLTQWPFSLYSSSSSWMRIFQLVHGLSPTSFLIYRAPWVELLWWRPLKLEVDAVVNFEPSADAQKASGYSFSLASFEYFLHI